MANRHSNKKLRERVRQRMVDAGATYQRALNDLLHEKAERRRRGRVESVDLVIGYYFGWPIVLAVYEATEPVGRPVILRIPSSLDWSSGARMPVPFQSFRPEGYQ